jgi:DNA-directed RNA polymerase specialized sigma24 family protein
MLASVAKSLCHSKVVMDKRQGRAGFLEKEASEVLEALDKLAAEDPAKAEEVKLRFFAGLTMPEVAKVMNVSLATAERHWTYARTWLYAELKDRGDTTNGKKMFF